MTPVAAIRQWVADATLEEILTHAEFFGLTTASPVQRAVCRIADGLSLGALRDDANVQKAVGNVEALPSRPPKELTWVSGIRVAKSLLAAAIAVRVSQRAVIPEYVKSGEIPRFPMLSVDKDKATPILNHLMGALTGSRILKSILLGSGAESVTLRHPSGRPIECIVTAGKRAGSAVVAYWLVGVALDEFPRMSGAGDAVISWDETRDAAMGRIFSGGTIYNLGSPYAPFGPAFDQVTKFHGKPSGDLVVIWSDGPSTNPIVWTPEACEDMRRRKPEQYRTDVMAEFATPEEALFSSDLIESATRKGHSLPRHEGWSYAAFIDPATRANAFTLLVVSRLGHRFVVASAREWVGTRDVPLDTREVLRELGHVLRAYGIDHVRSDRYLIDSLSSQAREFGFRIFAGSMTAQEQMERALLFRDKLVTGDVELCEVARGNDTVRTLSLDLKRVRRLATQMGAVVKLPLTGDGRHCDFWPPICMAMGAHLNDVKVVRHPENAEVTAMRAAAMKRFSAKKEHDDE